MDPAINTSINILIVDDHPLTRNMVRAILKGLGFENVQQAENGQIAVQRILEEPVDLVICDWNMPVMSGLEVLQQIRSDSKFKKLPFLMLTAEAYRENVTAAMQSGVSDYIIKPFTAEVLGSKIERILLNKAGKSPDKKKADN